MLVHAHSGLRWIALLLLVYTVLNAYLNRNSTVYSKKDKMVGLFAMVTLHVQFILGIILLFFNPETSGKFYQQNWMKMDVSRFYGMEHFAGMLLAITLVTIGYSKAKRTEAALQKHKTTLTFYALGLILILFFIPWPFRAALGGNWF